MPDFRIALTGDFLDESGAVAYGDIGLIDWQDSPSVRWHFIDDLSPRSGDPGYWERLYSLEVAARAHHGSRWPGGPSALGEAEHVCRGARRIWS